MPSKLVIQSTYDVVSDAGYIRFGTAPGSRTGSQEVLEVGPPDSAMILDLDRRGRIVGVEMLNQSTLLSQPTRKDFVTSYDPEVDAAWIVMVEGRASSRDTVVLYEVGVGQMLADLDDEGRVLDFELLDVKDLLAAPTFE